MVDGRRRFGPIAAPPGRVVRVPPSEAFLVSALVPRGAAEERCREAIQGGFLRPVDSHLADLEAVQLVWVPLWRVEAATGGVRPRVLVALVLAREGLPFDPSRALAPFEKGDLVSRDRRAPLDGEDLAPDVPRAEAERLALERLAREVPTSGARGEAPGLTLREAVLCHYPVWLRRYTYAGEAASGDGPEECHVALSARTGAVVSARHPSALRSLAGRVRRLFKRA